MLDHQKSALAEWSIVVEGYLFAQHIMRKSNSRVAVTSEKDNLLGHQKSC